jgi:hypothetical protein
MDEFFYFNAHRWIFHFNNHGQNFFYLDGHRLSDFSEGALVSCAKGSLAKEGWMDGLRSSLFFLLEKCRQKQK